MSTETLNSGLIYIIHSIEEEGKIKDFIRKKVNAFKDAINNNGCKVSKVYYGVKDSFSDEEEFMKMVTQRKDMSSQLREIVFFKLEEPIPLKKIDELHLAISEEVKDAYDSVLLLNDELAFQSYDSGKYAGGWFPNEEYFDEDEGYIIDEITLSYSYKYLKEIHVAIKMILES